MEKKIEKMGHFLVPSSTSEGVVDALRSLADKLNEIIDHLNSQAQPEEKEEWKKRYVKRFGYWSEEIKFIQQLLNEREKEVRKSVLKEVREWLFSYLVKLNKEEK